MVKYSDREQQRLREIREAFTRRYPWLKLEFPAALRNDDRTKATVDPGQINDDWLKATLGLTDTMTVRQLEATLMANYGIDVQVFRKSGKFWIETRMTRDWTLKRQNDQGRDLDI